MQSHQNKFHIATIRALTARFASIKDGDIVHAADKELWEYLAGLYKNSNKGIKGRGKNRKIDSNNLSALSSGMRNLGIRGGGYSISAAGRGNMITGVGAGVMEIRHNRCRRRSGLVALRANNILYWLALGANNSPRNDLRGRVPPAQYYYRYGRCLL
jgi:hypothetical protein